MCLLLYNNTRRRIVARYKFLNINPLNKKEEDCVCRAISLALNKDYYEVLEDLELIGKLFECESLCVCCYKFLLDNVYDLKRIEETKGMTIDEFCEIFSEGIYLVRIEGHLTCIIDGICYDIWNCTNEKIDIVWEIRSVCE